METLALSAERQLTVRVWPGRGKPLVLLHGLLDTSAAWNTVAQNATRPCYALDLPGFGESSLPTHNTIDSYAQDVTAALGILGIDGFDLIGHSLGGAIATVLAEAHPEKVRSLTLFAPVGFGRVAAAELGRLPMADRIVSKTVQLALARPLATRMIFAAFVANGQKPTSSMVDELRAHAEPWSRGTACAVQAILRICDGSGALHRRWLRYKGPVRVLWGARDMLVPVSHAKALACCLPQAEITVWPGMGHYPQHERADELDNYLSAVSSRAPKTGRIKPPVIRTAPALA